MPDRSVSLPLCGGGTKTTATGWKEKGVMHTKEKEREIEVRGAIKKNKQYIYRHYPN